MTVHSLRMATFMIIMLLVITSFPTAISSAAEATVTVISVLRRQEPITQYSTAASEIPTLDPQLATDSVSITPIENLFLGLTDADPLIPGQINPELATEWSSSDDGLVWTFTLRDDIPWVRLDPVSDDAKILRMVVAQDIEYGIKRACDPRLLSQYGDSTIRPIVAGCDDALSIPTADFTDADLDLIQVEALDDTTLQITLNYAAGYFLSQTAMWVYRPVHPETLEEFGDNWTEPGNITTNGPFMIDEWVRGVRRVYIRNPHLPADLFGPGNLERKVETVVQDLGTQFALFLDGKIDSTAIPVAELQSVLQDPQYNEQVVQVVQPATFFIAFAIDKPPFDNVHLRRAFSASVDRQAFVQEVVQGQGIAMIHFTPPGMFGAPPINEVGVGYNPEYAREQLELAGYAGCEGVPDVEVLVASSSGAAWAEYLSASVENELGCDQNLMTITQQEWGVFLETIDRDNPPEDRPNLWTLGWSPDYPDANNWVNDVLSCESIQNDTARPCSEVDDLIIQAAQESNSELRQEMYYRIEEMFFGEEGMHPIIPLYMPLSYALVRPYYTVPYETDGIFGGVHWNYRSIDQDGQRAMRGE